MIVDAHLDLAMNALEWNRDLSRPAVEVRAREQALTDKPDRGQGTVSFPDMRRGGVGVCVATQIARYVGPGNRLSGWHSPEQAWAMTQGQLAWYRSMEERRILTPIVDGGSLDRHLAQWEDRVAGAELPIGYVLSLEGADSIVTLGHLERAYGYGLRAVGPAHYGPGVYANGTSATGDLGPRGRELVREMDRLGMILDATHLCDDSFRDALDHFHGPVWASHSNCRALVAHDRQFTDEQLRELIARGAVIGAAFDAWMLVPDWVRGQSTPVARGVSLDTVVDHLDHICQLAGNASHCGIGSDLDGAFGREQCPAEIDTIADLTLLPAILSRRGYTDADVEAVMGGNWVRFMRDAWA
ncbi:MAG: membrane dipeptidase [Vicinamibacterales bacterium]